MILGGPYGGYQATAEQGYKLHPQPLQAETGISAQIFMQVCNKLTIMRNVVKSDCLRAVKG